MPLRMSDIPKNVFDKKKSRQSITDLENGTVLTIAVNGLAKKTKQNRKNESIEYWILTVNGIEYTLSKRLASKLERALDYVRAQNEDSLFVTIDKDKRGRVSFV